MKDTQDKIGYCQLSLGLLYEDSTEYDNNGEVYPVSKQEISHIVDLHNNLKEKFKII